MYFKLFFISENSLKNYDFHKWFHLGHVTGTWQAIRKMSIRNKWNPVGLWKIFIWIFTCENADIPYNCLYGASLVFHLCKRTWSHGIHKVIHKWNFFFGTEGNTYAKDLLLHWTRQNGLGTTRSKQNRKKRFRSKRERAHSRTHQSVALWVFS